MASYKTEAVRELAAQINAAGFRVFIAESGTHGFYTDAEGARVVSFQYDLGGFKFSGNYKSQGCGTGWIIDDKGDYSPESLRTMLDSGAPRWATQGREVHLTTLAQYLTAYQSSSRFVGFEPASE